MKIWEVFDVSGSSFAVDMTFQSNFISTFAHEPSGMQKETFCHLLKELWERNVMEFWSWRDGKLVEHAHGSKI